MKKLFLFLLFLFAGAVPAQENAALPLVPVPDVAKSSLADARLQAAQNEPVLTLEAAVALALKNNPTPQAARAALDAALARIGIARAAGGPQLSASGSVDYSKGFGRRTTTFSSGSGTSTSFSGGGNGNNTTESLGLNGSLPLYNGGRVKASRRSAEAAARSQLATTQQTEQELAAQTILAYLFVLEARELLDVADSNLDVARERRRVSGVRFEAGAAARLEVLNADSSVATAQQTRISTSNSLAQSVAALNILMARDPETPVKLLPIPPLNVAILQFPSNTNFPLAAQATAIANGGAIPPSAELRAAAGQTLPSLAATRETVSAAEANIDVQKAAKKPQIGLSLSAFLRNPAQSVGRLLFSAGASLAQNVFDSGRVSSQVREAQAVAQQARFGLAGQQLQVANAIEGSLLNLDSALKRFASADTAVIAAQEALRSARLGFEAGVLTPLDVSTAQNALLLAQDDAIEARFEVAQAQIQLAAATAVTVSGSATGRSGLGSSAGTGRNSTSSASGANQSLGTTSSTSTSNSTFGNTFGTTNQTGTTFGNTNFGNTTGNTTTGGNQNF